MFETIKSRGFEVLTLHHAEAILQHDMPDAIGELESIMEAIRIPISELVHGGGGEGRGTQRLRRALAELGLKKHRFEIKKIVDGVEKESISHEIDHVKVFGGWTFALEVEWNNKDPFFDRDLENFKRLHADGVISIGVIITRGKSLQDALRRLIERFALEQSINTLESLNPFYTPTHRQRQLIAKAANSLGSFEKGWAHSFVADKFGEATTHWRKLEERVSRGVGNPCPLLLIGIPEQSVIFDPNA
ncbi:MAG: BglII/BstYI family type II restriction endonuclease [Chthoniobacteraceae bacterium]